MLAFQQGVQGYVTVYAYSAFKTAPAINTAYILAQIIGGILRLPIAKLINIWGRAETFFLFTVIYLIGMIVLASSNGPSSYAAGYTIYWIGYETKNPLIVAIPTDIHVPTDTTPSTSSSTSSSPTPSA